jgi:hypothetical protein
VAIITTGRLNFSKRNVINRFTELATASNILMTVFYQRWQHNVGSALLSFTSQFRIWQRELPARVGAVANLIRAIKVVQETKVNSKNILIFCWSLPTCHYNIEYCSLIELYVCITFNALRAVRKKITIDWNVTSGSLVELYRLLSQLSVELVHLKCQ